MAKSDRCKISPAASPVILHHTVWRTWLFIAHSDGRWLYYQLSLYLTCAFLLKSWGECMFLNLGVKGLNNQTAWRVLEEPQEHSSPFEDGPQTQSRKYDRLQCKVSTVLSIRSYFLWDNSVVQSWKREKPLNFHPITTRVHLIAAKHISIWETILLC